MPTSTDLLVAIASSTDKIATDADIIKWCIGVSIFVAFFVIGFWTFGNK